MIIIVDNNMKEVEILSALQKNVDSETEVRSFTDYFSAWKGILHSGCEMIIVNPFMADGEDVFASGYEFVRKLRKYEPCRFTDVVIKSSVEDASCFGFSSLFCSGYIKSPVRRKEAEALLRYLGDRRKQSESREALMKGMLLVRRRSEFEIISSEDVIWTESKEDNIYFHTKEGLKCYDVRLLAKYRDLISRLGLLRISRWDAVNPEYIAGFRGNEISLRGMDKTLHVTDTGRRNIEERLLRSAFSDKIKTRERLEGSNTNDSKTYR